MKATCILIVVCVALPAVMWAGWTSETVASYGDVGDGCCLAVDRSGRPHISFVDKTGGKVMYTRYTGSSWEFDTVAFDVEVPGHTGLALDSTDIPHIIFRDAKTGELTYAYHSGTNWVTEKVSSSSSYIQFVSITALPPGPRVSYSVAGSSSTSLVYAYRDGEGWHNTAITSGGGQSNTLFLDDNTNSNIVYYNSSTYSVKRAVLKNDEWSIDDIAEGVDPGAVAGPDDKIHVGFATLSNKGLNYAVSTSGGSWKIENVPGVQGEPAYTDISVNAAANVFLSYFNFNKSNLHVMIKKGAGWTHEIVARGAYVGLPHSSVISGNYPLIAYYDAGKKDLKLARYVTDIELTSFKAVRNREAVDIRWAVSGDGGTAGYNLYRAAPGAERAKVNPSLITGSSPFLFRDAAAKSAVAYRYWLELVPLTGTSRTYGPASVPPAGKAHAFALFQNVPNPVARATTFTFELAEGADVRLVVYDAAGRRVAAVAEGHYGPGRHDVPFQSDLAPGVYVYRLDADAKTAARKMVVIK
ncbi:MAG: T9SS type A sorting domain-containing protein [bacterium]